VLSLAPTEGNRRKLTIVPQRNSGRRQQTNELSYVIAPMKVGHTSDIALAFRIDDFTRSFAEFSDVPIDNDTFLFRSDGVSLKSSYSNVTGVPDAVSCLISASTRSG
jgi:hypothetical protein